MSETLQYDLTESADYLDKVFSEDGQFENKNGRFQTRRFAECFVRNVSISPNDFSLLDVGCALGDAIPVLHNAYPMARLAGCDLSGIAIERCTKDYGHLATFFRAGFEDMSGTWDIIYCSNVLEHFERYHEIAAWLLSKCRTLYVMTPYMELKNGLPIDPKASDGHKVTLDEHSFDSLYDEGLLADSIRTTIIRCPGAWSSPLWKESIRAAKRAALKILLNKHVPPKGRQIIYELNRRQPPACQ